MNVSSTERTLTFGLKSDSGRLAHRKIMNKIRYGPVLLVLLLIFVVRCAPLSYQHISESFQRPEECQRLFEQLDASVTEAGVRDASGYPIPGFPYLRTNRFLSALKTKIRETGEKGEWLQWMHVLDLKAREKEISNLRENIVLSSGLSFGLSKEGGQTPRDKLNASVKACSDKLLQHDRSQPELARR